MMPMLCGICMTPVVAGGAMRFAPCGHRGAHFHEACLVEWSAQHARCPHCNAPDTEGTVGRLVRWWMVQEEAEVEEGGGRRWGPLFIALAPRAAEVEEGAAEAEAARVLLRTLLATVEGARVVRRSPRTLGVAAMRRGPDRRIEVMLKRTAWVGPRGQRLRDGFMLSAVRRRVVPTTTTTTTTTTPRTTTTTTGTTAEEEEVASGETLSGVRAVLTVPARR
jgi:hypothetical protein